MEESYGFDWGGIEEIGAKESSAHFTIVLGLTIEAEDWRREKAYYAEFQIVTGGFFIFWEGVTLALK